MQQSPSLEYKSFTSSQEIPHILWKPKIHYRMHKCPPPVSILCQSNPYSISRRSVLILSSHLHLGSSKRSFSVKSFHLNPLGTFPLFHTCHMHRPSHCSGLDQPSHIWRTCIANSRSAKITELSFCHFRLYLELKVIK